MGLTDKEKEIGIAGAFSLGAGLMTGLRTLSEGDAARDPNTSLGQLEALVDKTGLVAWAREHHKTTHVLEVILWVVSAIMWLKVYFGASDAVGPDAKEAGPTLLTGSENKNLLLASRMLVTLAGKDGAHEFLDGLKQLFAEPKLLDQYVERRRVYGDG